MKKLGSFLIILVCTSTSFSKEDDRITISSAADFYEYCSTDHNNSCGELLNHEGHTIAMTGYINASYILPLYNSFYLFDSVSIDFSHCLVVKAYNADIAIFDKLSNSLDSLNILNFTKIQVIGKIGGSNVWYVNKGCNRIPEFAVDNSNDIYIIKY
jgi:hypothetical protein